MSLSFFISDSRARRFETLPLELTPTKSSATIASTVAISCLPTAASQRFSLSFNAASTLIFFAGFSAAAEAAGEGEAAAAASFSFAAGDSSEVAVDLAVGAADGVGVAVSCTVVEAFSSGATEGDSSCPSADVTKLNAATPRSDAVSFMRFSFLKLLFRTQDRAASVPPLCRLPNATCARSALLLLERTRRAVRRSRLIAAFQFESVGRNRRQSLNTQRFRHRPVEPPIQRLVGRLGKVL